jgi:hypothetical protein
MDEGVCKACMDIRWERKKLPLLKPCMLFAVSEACFSLDLPLFPFIPASRGRVDGSILQRASCNAR